jgi:hypothetical protein
MKVAPQKANCPVGAGQSADTKTDGAILATAEKIGNKPARLDCRLPDGCTAFPAEFLSKRAAAKYLALVHEATRIGATVDLIVGPYRRRPDYLVRLGNVSRRLNEIEAASRWLKTLQDGDNE